VKPRKEKVKIMNKAELVSDIAHRVEGGTKADAQRYLDAAMAAISDALERDESVSLIGFGNFKTSYRQQRDGQNPQTGEKITIPGGRVVRFKQSSRLKERLNN
jgi:nucleoid DNA-binding protein